MNNDLKISIVGTLNTGKSIGEINTAVRGIEQKIRKLNLKIEVDQKVFNALNNFNKQITKLSDSARNAKKVIEETLMPDGTKIKRTHFDGLGNEFSEIIDESKKLKSSVEKTTNAMDGQIKSAEQLAKEVGKVTKETELLNSQQEKLRGKTFVQNETGSIKRTINTDADGNVTSLTDTYDYLKDEKDKQQLLEQMANFREQSTLRRRQEESKWNEAQRQAINKNAELERQEIAKTQKARESYENWWIQAASEREKKEQAQIEKLEHQLKLYKEQAEINVTNLKRKYKDSDVDTKGLDEYLEKVKKLEIDPLNTSKVSKDMDTLGLSFKKLSADVKAATSHTLSFGDQMKIAFDRTLIWSSVMTGIYGTVHALQAMTREVLLIDEAMTELKRVMDVAPQTYNELLHESIQLSKDLGNNVHEILAAVNGFARAGEYTKDQLLDLAKTVTVASNVSDLNAEEAMENLISVMNVYKIAASETMTVVDKMNEVDNNFAVSTKQISDAMAKSSGVAASFGVSIDELIGDITSIASVTFESGSIIGRALKTIYSRITTMDGAADVLNSVGIGIKNMAGDNREVADIISDLRGKWDSLSNAQQQNIAVTLAGRDQLTRFIAMMNSADIAISATETSINSQGSAIRENEKYLQSMGAQINMLKSSFTELSVTVGENGLGQSFMAIVKTLTFMANGFSQFTETTKGLNIILPLLALGVYGAVKAFTALRVAATGAKLSLGWIGLGVIALEGLATAGFGAGRALGETVDTLVNSSNGYTQTADKLEQLVARYDELKPKAERSSAAQTELKNVLDEINKIAPSVVDNTDKYGDSLELNKEKVDEFTKSLRTMSDEQLASATVQLNTDFSKAKNDLDNLKVKEKEAKKGISDLYNFMLEYQQKFNVTSMVEAANEYATRSSKLSGKALREAANDFGQYNLIMTKHNTEISKYGDLLTDIDNKQAEVDGLETRRKQIEFLTSDYKELANSVKTTFSGKIDSSIYGNFDKSQLTGLVEFGKKINENKGTIQDYIPILENAKLTQEQIKTITDALSNSVQTSTGEWEAYAEGVDNATESEKSKLTTTERLLGVSKDQLTSTQEMISAYQLLSQMENLSAEQKELLGEATAYLSSLYPDLISGSQLNTEMMQKEIDATDVLGQAIDLMASGQVSAQDSMTIAAAIGTKNRLNLLRKEIQAYNEFFAQANDSAKTLESEKIAMKKLPTIQIDIDSLIGDLDNHSGTLSKSLDLTPKSSSKKDAKDKKSGSSKSDKNKVDNLKQINKTLADSQLKYKQLDTHMAAYESKMSKQNELSKEYSQNLNNQLILLNDKKKRVQSDIDAVDVRLKSTKLTSEERTELQGKFTDLKGMLTNVENEITSQLDKINEIPIKRAQKKIEDLTKLYSDKMSNLDYGLSLEQAKGSKLDEGSPEWIANQKNQAVYIKDKIKSVEEEQAAIDKLLKTEKLSAEQKVELRSRYKELNLEVVNLNNELIDIDNTILDNAKRFADETIELAKKSYEMERELKVKSIEEEMRLHEKSHQQKMDQYDAEMDKFEENVNRQLRLLDDQENSENYNKELGKLQSDEQSLQNRISRLSLDDSQEGISKRLELEQQLRDVQEQIADKKHSREVDLRKQNLQDQLDTYQKDIEAKKQAEQMKYDIGRESFDKQLNDINYYYDELLNNEQMWAIEHNKIVDGNTEYMKNKLGEFLSSFKSQNEEVIKSLGSSWQSLQNIIDGISKSAIGVNVKSYPVGTNPFNPKGSIPQYHEGGVVGGKGSKLAEFFNRMANIKPSEEISKLKLGEVVFNNSGLQNLVGHFQNMAMPKFSPSASGGGFSPTVNINIDNFSGTPSQMNALETRLVNTLKNFGKI